MGLITMSASNNTGDSSGNNINNKAGMDVVKSNGVKKFAVFGNPIAQSKSPVIHHAFAEQVNLNIDYTKQLVDVDGFAGAANAFFTAGGDGLNITSPFKYDAFQFADHLTQRAQLAEAVNTLAKQDDGSILGDNTDSVGLLNDITQQLGWVVKDKRILILGAGGAVRGVLYPFLQAQPQQLIIANRTKSKATDLAEKFSEFGAIRGYSYDELVGETVFDVIINATSASLNGAAIPYLPQNCFTRDTAFYDMTYSTELTPFLQWAKQQNAQHYADGLGMLIGQAAESFTLWTGLKPEIQPVFSLFK